MYDQFLSHIMPVSALFIAGQGTSVLLLLLSIKKKNTAFYFLSAYISLNSFLFIVEYLLYSRINVQLIIDKTSMLYSLRGCILYLYVKALTTPNFRLQRQHSIHLLPPVTFVILNHLYLSGNIQYAKTLLHPSTFALYYHILLVCYWAAAARLIPGYHKNILQYFSTVDSISLDWLYKVMMVHLFFTFIYVALHMSWLYELIDASIMNIASINNKLVFFISFYFIAIGGYRRELTGVDVNYEMESGSVNEGDGKVDRQPLFDDKTGKDIWKKLNEYMQDKEPFLDEGLNLQQLAVGIGVPPRHLSQVLKLIANQSFYDFVNGCRVEKARQLIESDSLREMPMVDVGIEAGFANKVTFYKYFKKHFSKTPLQYQKTLVRKSKV